MTRPQMRALGTAALALLLVVAGCKDTTQPTRVPSTLSLDRSTLVVDDGATVQLTATLRDQNGTPFETLPAGFTLQWTSTNNMVASVSADGLVSGNQPGTAEIRVNAGELSATAATTVRQLATSVEHVAGDGQSAAAGEALPDQVAVRVVDRHRQGVGGVQVSFTVTGGEGTVMPASVTTDDSGIARTTWTMGEVLGEASLEARVEGLTGSPVGFRATALPPSSIVLRGVSPDPMVEGQAATITGEGFSPTPAANLVTIGGVAATVTAASETSLEILVPAGVCEPTGPVDVRVTIGPERSNLLRAPFRPAEYLSLQVGEQRMVRDPARFCLHFAPSAANEAYLVGVQSISEAVGALTPVSLVGNVAQGPMAAPASAPLPPETHATPRVAPQAVAALFGERQAAHRARHAATEARLRQWERRIMEPRMAEALRGPSRPEGARALSVPPDVQEGDTVDIRFPDVRTSNFCNVFVPIRTVVRRIGARGIWLEDVANPAGGFRAEDFAALSSFFDASVYGTLSDYFGAPTDIDGNDKIVIVATREVNRVGAAGFVVSTDFAPRGVCASSNEGEVYYSEVPDPLGTVGDARSQADVVGFAHIVLPHEFTHLIQFGRRLQVPGAVNFPSVWEAEGQATLAEEIMGYALTGRQPGQNYGASVIFNTPPTTEHDWHLGAFFGLAQYFGFMSTSTRSPTAPERCSWLGRLDDQVGHGCGGGSPVYGVSWSFLRWLSDHYGARFPGGERGMHQALIENRFEGFRTIEEVIGEPIDELLAPWAAMLYVDDRVPGAAPPLTLPSWNMLDFQENVVPTARLEPRQRAFTSFTESASIAAASSVYLRVSGSNRPAAAIRARDGNGNPLPAYMRFWVVRLQ